MTFPRPERQDDHVGGRKQEGGLPGAHSALAHRTWPPSSTHPSRSRARPSRPARCEGSGKARATAAARTPIATKVTRVPAECVALNLDTPMACRTAHSAVLGIKTIKMAIAHSARRVLSPTTANAGRHVTAQRSTDLGCTLAMRSPMRANIAKTTTDACRGSVARTTIAAVTPQWLRAAAFAHGATEHAPP